MSPSTDPLVLKAEAEMTLVVKATAMTLVVKAEAEMTLVVKATAMTLVVKARSLNISAA